MLRISKALSEGDILVIKATLIGSRPAIWRRLVVPANYSFFDLHCALQDVFGWEEAHLHQFFTDSPFKRAANYTRISFPMPNEDMFGDESPLDERATMISTYLQKPKDSVFYEYDFGDSWIHELVLEKVAQREKGTRYPILLDGKNACPPEDCGGLGGYYHLLEVLKDPDHEEYEDMLEWLDIEDPKEFDMHVFDRSSVRFQDPKKALKRYERGFGI